MPAVPPAAGAAPALTEQEVSFSDVPFRGIVEQALAGVYVVLDERFMYANDTFAAMFDYERSKFIGTRMADVVLPEMPDEVMRNYRLRISGEVAVIRYLTQCRRRDGQVVHLELQARKVTVGLRCTAGVFLVRIVDDGCGISPEPSRQRSIGLFSKSERARVKGQSLTDIGQNMCLSVKTVSAHRARILDKLGRRATRSWCKYAMRNGLVD
jgi:PAS domain S-box-containing protein